MVDKGCSRVYLAVLYSVAEEGEIASARVGGENFRETRGQFPCRAHRRRPAPQEPQRAGLPQDVDIEREEQGALVEPPAPKAGIDGRAVAHHPSEEQAEPLAGGRAVFRNDGRGAARESAAEGAQGARAVGGAGIAEEGSQRPVAAEETAEDGKELVHPPEGEEAVEAARVPGAEDAGETAGKNPAVDVASGRVPDPADFGEELRAAAVAQARGDESRRFRVGAGSRAAQEAGRVAVGKGGRFVAVGQTPEKVFPHATHSCAVLGIPCPSLP